jgi:hypothetical protein
MSNPSERKGVDDPVKFIALRLPLGALREAMIHANSAEIIGLRGALYAAHAAIAEKTKAASLQAFGEAKAATNDNAGTETT